MKNPSLILAVLATIYNTADAAVSQSQWYSTMKAPNERFVLNAEQAATAIQAAAAIAANNSSPSSIVVTDPSGYLIGLLRMDNAWIETIDTCIRKARTVSLYNGAFTSGDLQPEVQPGKEDYGIENTNGGMLPIPGAIPLFINGTFFAAIGVCGGSGQQDLDAATAGVHAVGGSLTL